MGTRAAAWTTLVIFIIGLGGAGCISATYQPKGYPYLKIVQDRGMTWVQTDVVRNRFTPFTGGLQGAVGAVPRARELAAQSRSDAVTGLIMLGVGPGVMVLGAGLLAAGLVNEEDPTSGTNLLAIATMLTGVAIMGTSIFFVERSMVLQYDAINVYNDAMWEAHTGVVEEAPAETLPTPQPPQGPPSVPPAPQVD